MNKINMAVADTIIGGSDEVCNVTNVQITNNGKRECLSVSVCSDKFGGASREVWTPVSLSVCGVSGS